MPDYQRTCASCQKISDGVELSCEHFLDYNCAINLFESGEDSCPGCKRKQPLPKIILSFLIGTDMDLDYIRQYEIFEDLIDLLNLCMKSRFEIPDDVASIIISRALQLGWNINPSKNNPLIQACRFGYINVVKVLLEYDEIDVNVCVDDTLPIVAASTARMLDLVKLLIERGADINKYPSVKFQRNSIIQACIHGDLDTVNYLIDHGADLSSKDNYDLGLLHNACIAGRSEIAFRLIELGVGIGPDENHSDLIIASFMGKNMEIFKKLLSIGIDVKITNDKEAVEFLYYATLSGNIEILNYVIDKGGKVGNVDDDRKSPLHYACGMNYIEIARRIIEVGGDVNERFDRFTQETPLHVACQMKKPEAAILLLDSGADPEINDKYGRNSLFFAYFYEQIHIIMHPKIRSRTVRWAISSSKEGLDFSVEDFMALGKKELFDYLKNHLERKNILIEEHVIMIIKALKHFDINSLYDDSEGKCKVTLLYLAVKNNHSDIVEILLENGADPNIPVKNESVYAGETDTIDSSKNLPSEDLSKKSRNESKVTCCIIS